MKKHHSWEAVTGAPVPLWISPDRPTWVVLTEVADQLLKNPDQFPQEFQALHNRLPQSLPAPYTRRDPQRNPLPLEELWLHLTDQCNLSCSHCLFSSSPETTTSLSTDQALSLVSQAKDAGCAIIALTGGEPMVHPGFHTIVSEIMDTTTAQCALLTNGLLVDQHLDADWPRERISLQISLDGTPSVHDQIRGKGTFEALCSQLRWLTNNHWHVTISWCVTTDNLSDLPWLISFAAEYQVAAVHFMWHVIRGRGDMSQHPTPDAIMGPLTEAIVLAEKLGVLIDNIEQLQRQLLAPPGTRFDGSSAGVTCAAIGPDNRLYPSAATVGIPELATTMPNGLLAAWQSSPVLHAIRNYSVIDRHNDPWRFLLGGGDFDQRYLSNGSIDGEDPYYPLYQALSCWLIARLAQRYPDNGRSGVRLAMGEYLSACGIDKPEAVCNSTCLLSLHGALDARSAVKSYYDGSAGDKRAEILNPVSYDPLMMTHIPDEYRFRGYGCGSPVLDAGITAGETVVDLGCGSGVECFIAARLVGPNGHVIGVDMLDSMLHVAKTGAQAVMQKLGYTNLEFINGYLEALPLADQSVDVIVSNCVLNLSADKRTLFHEILRVLKPGGRLVAADVVCDHEPAASILHDPTLKGECISGALTQKDLVAILDETGFDSFTALKRSPYRVVADHPFFSLTFSVFKPEAVDQEYETVCYPGPARQLVSPAGVLLPAGTPVRLSTREAELLDAQLWRFAEDGSIHNRIMVSSCCLPPEADHPAPAVSLPRLTSDCMACGAPLVYQSMPTDMHCTYCGATRSSNAACVEGHFVCERCHSGDSHQIITAICCEKRTHDPIALMRTIRQHPALPLHGAHHHAMVPGIILSCLRSLGATVHDTMIENAIQRGGAVEGGSCSFYGVCGAATGVGIAVSILLEATPLTAQGRQKAQQAVHSVLGEIATYTAARCCQRDTFIALQKGMEICGELIGLTTTYPEPFACTQMARNQECLGIQCPLWP